MQHCEEKLKTEEGKNSILESKVTSMQEDLNKKDTENKKMAEEFIKYYTEFDKKLQLMFKNVNFNKLQTPSKPQVMPVSAITPPNTPVVIQKILASTSVSVTGPSTWSQCSITPLPVQISRNSFLSSDGEDSQPTLEEST